MKYVIGFFLCFISLCAPTGAQTQSPIRVICGGGAYTDSLGHAWQADFGYNDGTVSSNGKSISGTKDPQLFHSGRYNDVLTDPLTYTFPVAGGIYHVNLYFAETSGGEETVGARVFNVRIQGQMIFQNLDVFAAVGANAALIKGADIAVTNGTLTIELDNIVQNPKINAIEITQTSPAPQMTLNFNYPDGTPVAGTLSYQMSTSQMVMSGSAPLNKGSATCYLFSSPSALGLTGTFQITLSLLDSAGNMLWQINLGMDPSTVNIASVQGSSLNVVVQKQ